MKAGVFFALMLLIAALAVTLAVIQHPRQSDIPEPTQLSTGSSPPLPAHTTPKAGPEPEQGPAQKRPEGTPRDAVNPVAFGTNKLERLTKIRELFHSLASHDPTAALRAAKQFADGTERETALLTLVTEWTHGELRPPSERAEAISAHGLEAGLGLELAKNPELAVLWANELTDGPGRTVVLEQAAIGMASYDPAAAFALGEQLPAGERRKFYDAIFAGWASSDTTAALQWANQLADPVEQDAAKQAIWRAAPVGIGAALGMQDGYPVVNQLIPGTPAELSGQLRPGDRILALAQGDNAFVDAHGLSLQEVVQMIRGAPGTVVQLQVAAADGQALAETRTVAIVRDQITFKR